MELIEYFRKIAAFSQSLQPRASALDFLRQLASLDVGSSPAAEQVQNSPTSGLDDTILTHRDRILLLALGASTLKRRGLSDTADASLRVLESPNDLLHSIGRLRDEEAHTKVLSHLLCPAGKVDGIGYRLLESFLLLAGASWKDEFLSIATRVEPEYTIVSGRVDLRISNGDSDLFVEVKVHAAEGDHQLERYGRVQEERAGMDAVRLVYLTLASPEHSQSSPRTQYTVSRIGLRQLLCIWLPIASESNSSDSSLLRLYLKSLALLLGVAGVGRFEQWHFTEQQRGLAIVYESEARNG